MTYGKLCETGVLLMNDDIKKLYNVIRKALEYLIKCNNDGTLDVNQAMFPDLIQSVSLLNAELFYGDELDNMTFSAFPEKCENEELIDILNKIIAWYNFIGVIIEGRDNSENYIDKEFQKIVDSATFCTEESMIENTKNQLLNVNNRHLAIYEEYYQLYDYFWGTLDIANNRFDVIENRVRVLKERCEDFVWLYNRLGDFRSKLVLCYMLRNWLTFDPENIQAMKENSFEDYYDLDLIQCDENEVMVDIGAFIGDSAEGYINVYGKYKSIYCYDIVPQNIAVMEGKFKDKENIFVRHNAVGSENKMVSFDINSENALVSPVATVNDNGTANNDLLMVTIDDDITEKVTLIKMDIEGSEKDALKGCERHIKEEKPKLLICVYHGNTDIVDIPKQICGVRNDYKLYLRSNGLQPGPSEIVLFAL